MFGGGAVLAGMTTMNIGDRNAEFVRRYLALEKIRIVAEDLQGMHPRKVAFMPRTGKVMVKRLQPQQETSVAEREQALAAQRRSARGAARAGASARRVVQSSRQAAHGAVRRGDGEHCAEARRAAAKRRIELFGCIGHARSDSNNAQKTIEEA